MLSLANLAAIQSALALLDLDGWLLADFQGTNPIAVGILGFQGMMTRRHLAFVPKQGIPIAIGHGIEPGAWSRWPAEWARRTYVGWRDLESHLREVVAGRRIAMEYSPGDAIPYLDRIPAGMLEMIRSAGATVVSSADLVTRFYATWTAEHLASHRRAAEILARIGPEAIVMAGRRARAARPMAEHDLREWVRGRMEEEGLVVEHPPLIAAGANSADVHYEASSTRPRLIQSGEVLLVDLWGRERDGVFADQTWMGVLGTASPRLESAWRAAVAARDAAIELLRQRVAAGAPVRGSDVHRETLRVIEAAGWLEHAVGRAGHSIDPRQYHGAGPNLDCVETQDDRLLVPGVGFSIEPGIYVPGEFGLRSEVNAFLTPDEVIVTPIEYQRELIVG